MPKKITYEEILEDYKKKKFKEMRKENSKFWKTLINYIKSLATVFLTMAMAAVGISINLSELKSMGYKPFVVGLIAAVTVGVVSIVSLETFLKVFL